ncbi:MAG TPA: hypothetical protein DDY31_18685 [Lachnospiraceae bacterium]|nr:hypothetical protein [Lachnospiraceae bacterium]
MKKIRGYWFVFFLFLFAAALCGVKLVKHEKLQQERLLSLEADVKLIYEKNNQPAAKWNPDGYNYLAIGNSITKHPVNEYWWNECGMAASTAENDFVHIISSKLNAKPYAYNFAAWEMTGHDRGEVLSLLDGVLGDALNLVTIQLSENVSDLSAFESDFEELIRYVQKGAPNAQIIVVGDFWDKGQKDKMKMESCSAAKVDFVSLDGIKGQAKYQCGVGTTVYDKEGSSHIVEHAGVAQHPNNEGMRWIAEKILDMVKEENDG